ncbi:MAG: DUF2178 domain-containing protein [Methanoregula sp.]|nr:DUF2178 domain-containing protein [Methanoregula sp.]
MKQNSFYILIGIVVTALVGVFWLSLQWNNSVPIQIGFIIGVITLYMARGRITGIIDDERSVAISQKAALRTLEVFWVVFFTFSLGIIVWTSSRFFGLEGTSTLRFIREHNPPGMGMDKPFFFNPGFIQLLLLCMTIFLYVGFKFYYERKYGGEDADEE